ncbi:MAG TPA: zinc-binding dehydrogenase [Polyangiales bacterium]
MSKVKTVVKAGPGQVELIDRELPGPKPGQALIRTTLSTVCGSDLHMVDDFPMAPAGQPQGHEAVGIVEDVGEGVTRIKKGDRVVTSCLIGCGHCHVCLAGDLCMCRTYKAPMNVLFGCQAEAFVVNSADLNMAVVPKDLSDKQALFTGDIMSTGFAAIERAHLKPGQSVAIFAQGPVGLCATAAAKFYGASRIITVESVPERVAMSKKLGATDVVDPEGAVDKIKELTKNQGVDVAVEALGREVTLESCLKVIRHGGTVSSVGVYPNMKAFSLPVNAIFSQFTFVTSMCPGGTERLNYLLGLIQSGKVDLTPLWTHDRKLSDIANVYEMFRKRQDGALKIALTS